MSRTAEKLIKTMLERNPDLGRDSRAYLKLLQRQYFLKESIVRNTVHVEYGQSL